MVGFVFLLTGGRHVLLDDPGVTNFTNSARFSKGDLVDWRDSQDVEFGMSVKLIYVSSRDERW
jgi:hypothetical protein